jgi:hypothetical protein
MERELVTRLVKLIPLSAAIQLSTHNGALQRTQFYIREIKIHPDQFLQIKVISMAELLLPLAIIHHHLQGPTIYSVDGIQHRTVLERRMQLVQPMLLLHKIRFYSRSGISMQRYLFPNRQWQDIAPLTS